MELLTQELLDVLEQLKWLVEKNPIAEREINFWRKHFLEKLEEASDLEDKTICPTFLYTPWEVIEKYGPYEYFKCLKKGCENENQST